MRTLVCVASLIALCAFTVPAAAGIIPATAIASLRVDGENFPVPVISDVDEGGKVMYFIDNVVIERAGEFRAMITGEIDPDPSIAYGLTVTDFGAPSSFSFSVTSPIILGPGPTLTRGSVVGGLTDATGNGVTITPTSADSDGDGAMELQTSSVGLPSANMGVDVGGTVSGGPGPAGSIYTYGSFAAGPLAGPAGPRTTMTVLAAFSLSGGGDIAALTGFTEITPIPEPSTIALASLLAIGCVGFVRARRRA